MEINAEKINAEKITINGINYIREDSIKQSNPFVNKEGFRYAIVRSKDQGVMCGFIKEIVGKQVVLLQARQMFRWDSDFVLPDIAEKGVRNSAKCKFSCEMSQDMIFLEACGVLYCTEKAAKELMGVPAQVCKEN